MPEHDQLLADFATGQAARRTEASNELDDLKAALIEPLRALGIASVTINFDGYGDQGAIDEIECCDSDGAAAALPDDAVVLLGPADAPRDEISLREALDTLAYTALELHHPGWEDNDGACGALEIDVAAATFTLECKQRYTAYDEHSSQL